MSRVMATHVRGHRAGRRRRSGAPSAHAASVDALRYAGYRVDSPLRVAVAAVGTALTVALVALVVALVVVPVASGGRALTVLTGSMEPVLSPGDVAVVRGVEVADVCTDVRVGQIVSYFPRQNDPELITHRVVGKTVGSFPDGTACRLVTRGDANTAADEPVSPAQLHGVFLYGVPKVGWVLNAAQGHRSAVIGVTVGLAIVAAAWSAIRPPKRRIVTTTSTQGVAGAGEGESPWAASAEALRLKERELDLKARELDLRERELDSLLSGGARTVLDAEETVQQR